MRELVRQAIEEHQAQRSEERIGVTQQPGSGDLEAVAGQAIRLARIATSTHLYHAARQTTPADAGTDDERSRPRCRRVREIQR